MFHATCYVLCAIFLHITLVRDMWFWKVGQVMVTEVKWGLLISNGIIWCQWGTQSLCQLWWRVVSTTCIFMTFVLTCLVVHAARTWEETPLFSSSCMNWWTGRNDNEVCSIYPINTETNYIKIFNSAPEIVWQFDIKTRRSFVSYATIYSS